MYSTHKIFALLLMLAAMAAAAFSQTNMKPTLIGGEVKAISDGKISLLTKDGVVEVTLSEKTEYRRVSAETPNLRTSVESTFAAIKVGDKLLVSGFPSADKKTMPANSVYLMTKDDLIKRDAKETAQWTTRGISGRVTAVDKASGTITVSVRGLMQTTDVVVTPKPNAIFKRYSPNSVEYSKAVASKFEDLSAGDMVRALGDRSADGAAFAAEEIVSGAFVTVVGTVKSVDTAANSVVVANLLTNTEVTVKLAATSMLKKFPEEFAQRMAGGMPGGMPGRPAGERPAGERPAGPPNGGAPGMGGRGSIDEMLERFPNITAADLKAGDMIAVSSTKQPEGQPLTAIKLLAGIEPFVAAQMAAMRNAAGRGQTMRQDSSFTIPGLDSFSNP